MMDRTLYYQRNIDYRAYHRVDQLWDFEAVLTDKKGFDFPRHDGRIIQVGTPYHEIHAYVTVDDEAVIQDLSIHYYHHPFKMCPKITERYLGLKGEKIDFAWPRLLRARAGGACGCSHLNDLLKGLLTAVFQALYYNPKPHSFHKVKDLKVVKNTCHAWKEGSEVYDLYYYADGDSES